MLSALEHHQATGPQSPITNLSYVLEINGGIEVGDILDAGLDHQVLLAGVGEGAKGHHPLRGPLVIAAPAPSSAPPETSSSSTPAPVTTSEPSSTAPTKAHDCRLCNKRLFEVWGSEKLGKYQNSKDRLHEPNIAGINR